MCFGLDGIILHDGCMRAILLKWRGMHITKHMHMCSGLDGIILHDACMRAILLEWRGVHVTEHMHMRVTGQRRQLDGRRAGVLEVRRLRGTH
jgi:hypothetical protein